MSGVNAWFRSVWGSPERYDSLLFRAYLVFLVFAIIFPWLAYAMPVGAARASIGPANLLLAGLLGTVGVGLLRGRLPALPRLRVAACALAAAVLVLSLAGLPKAEPVVTLQLLVTGSAGVATLFVTLALVHSEERLLAVLRWLVLLSTFTAFMTAVASLFFAWTSHLALSTGGDPLSIGAESDLFFRRQAASFISPDTATVLFALAVSVLVVGMFRSRWAVIWGGWLVTAGMVLIHSITVAIMQSISTDISFLVLGSLLGILVIGWVVPHPFTALARGVVALMVIGLFVAILAQVWGPTSGDAYYETIDVRDEVFGITVDRVVFANMGSRVEVGQQVVGLVTQSAGRFLFGTANTSLGAPGAHPHNGYLQLLLTGGFVLAGVYAVFLLAALWVRPGSLPSPLRAGLMAALGAGLIQNLFYLGLYEKLFLLLVGLVVAAVPIHEPSQLPMLTTWRQTKRETRAVRRRQMRAWRRPTPRHAVAVAGGRGVR